MTHAQKIIMKASFIVCVFALIFGITGCGSEQSQDSSSDSNVSHVTSSSHNGSYISEDEAKQVALEHAQVKESNTSDLEVVLDEVDVRPHYNVRFKAGGLACDYQIDAVSGEVISAEREINVKPLKKDEESDEGESEAEEANDDSNADPKAETDAKAQTDAKTTDAKATDAKATDAKAGADAKATESKGEAGSKETETKAGSNAAAGPSSKQNRG